MIETSKIDSTSICTTYLNVTTFSVSHYQNKYWLRLNAEENLRVTVFKY